MHTLPPLRHHLLLVAASVALSACGGGSSSDTDAKSDTASLAVGLIDIASLQSTTTSSTDKAATTTAKATHSCASGSIDSSAGISTDSGSPYTDQPFVTVTTTADQCSFSYSYSGSDATQSGTLSLNGAIVAGSAADGDTNYGFLTSGDSSTPLTLSASGSTTIMRDSGNRDYTFTLSDSGVLRSDSRTTSDAVDALWNLSESGSYTFTASANGFAGEYSLEVGTTDAPFTFHQDSSGQTFAGVIAYDVDQPRVPDSCKSATLQFETVEPLVPTGDADAPYSSGELRITSDNGAVITVTFQSGGKATVDAGAESQSYTFPALRALTEDCVTAIRSAIDARQAS